MAQKLSATNPEDIHGLIKAPAGIRKSEKARALSDYLRVKISLKDYRREWRTKRLDPRRGPMGQRPEDLRRTQPPPRMVRTTRLYPGAVDRRRTGVAAVVACFAAHPPSCKNSAGGSGSRTLRDWRQPRSGAKPPPHGEIRGDWRPQSCAVPDLQGLHSGHPDCPRFHRRFHRVCHPSLERGLQPFAGNSRSEISKITSRLVNWLKQIEVRVTSVKWAGWSS